MTLIESSITPQTSLFGCLTFSWFITRGSLRTHSKRKEQRWSKSFSRLTFSMILWAKPTKVSYQKSKEKVYSISLNMLKRWWNFANCEKREEISISRQTHHPKIAIMTSRMTKACQAFTAVIVKANLTVMIAKCSTTKTKILSKISKKASPSQMDKHPRSSHQSSAETSA